MALAQDTGIDTGPADNPYASRPFARIIGEPINTSVPAPEVIPGKYLADGETRRSNELTVVLNTDQPSILKEILPGAGRDQPPQVERTFLNAVKSHDLQVSHAFGSPIHARYLIEDFRMSDEDRALWQRANDGTLINGKPTHARVLLNRYIILRYESIALAEKARENLVQKAQVSYVTFNAPAVFSFTPNDFYYQGGATGAQRQWGLHYMNFPSAWDKTRGNAYLGILDRDFPGAYTYLAVNPHSELLQNYRPQFWRVASVNGAGLNHTIHVAGIAAAQFNNSSGVAGACPECSFTTFPVNVGFETNQTIESKLAENIFSAVEAGMQIINWSGGTQLGTNCTNAAPICNALTVAKERSVLVVIAAGNNGNATGYNNEPHFPANLHDGSSFPMSVLPVGGINQSGSRWMYPACIGTECGSNYPSAYGVMAPATEVASTFMPGGSYNESINCTDKTSADLSARNSAGIGDGIGSCTGTSMSAPFVTGLAGLMRSIYQRATSTEIRNWIRDSSSQTLARTAIFGAGVPNANVAVSKAAERNPTRLTPLFSLYSHTRMDSFYTTVPQMAWAALYGTLMPRGAGGGTYGHEYGSPISGYALPSDGPTFGGGPSPVAVAQVWIFTTDANPKVPSVPLSPVHRMSMKCVDRSPPVAVCNSNANHIDTLLATSDEVGNMKTLGYKVDGIEGFVYPKSQAQPTGTVKLMRLYNADRDDHAVFPESAYSTMYAAGYKTGTGGVNWIGYAYPNTAAMPSIP